MTDEYVTKLAMLPEYMQGGMKRYIEHGYRPGDFLTAVLSNDLMEAYSRADDVNAAAMRQYVLYLYNYTPTGCWGSPEKVDAWIEKGGLLGRLQ